MYTSSNPVYMRFLDIMYKNSNGGSHRHTLDHICRQKPKQSSLIHQVIYYFSIFLLPLVGYAAHFVDGTLPLLSHGTQHSQPEAKADFFWAELPLVTSHIPRTTMTASFNKCGKLPSVHSKWIIVFLIVAIWLKLQSYQEQCHPLSSNGLKI